MVEADLLNIIEVVAEDAELHGFPKTALALRQIIENNPSLRDGQFCRLRSVVPTHSASTLLN